ncbi:phosphoribosylglycinamide formyltransferase [Oxobacter pfennigii]|uniref:Phosphoribosylglycinamide formyltransferase n=1 Tax=Oxobacter pfennigii TaxID=36849 RepID=A0A0N8NTW0_9CLOT|nr:phosphoribosylglycinamide formyltransferase [Oxobacter pfennigii]KPU45928.1 phosphoribosylglycinamide formyltransferase [Oxobacter pfennigii]
MLKIGVLVSGGGTNLQAIIDDIKSGNIKGEIAVVITDRPEVYSLKRAENEGIPAAVFDRKIMTSKELNANILKELTEHNVDLVVLAGYLSILSKEIIERYQNAVINIHPSLIPSFCGDGYHGINVHKKALEYGVKVSGCTVHFVDEGTDTGPIILQKAVEVSDDDTPETLQKKILAYEHQLLPLAVKLICDGKVSISGRKVIIR